MKKTIPADFEQFFRRLAAGFTKRPDEIVVDIELVRGTVSMTLRPKADDTGSLIGTKGAMHASFLSVGSVLAGRHGLRFHLSKIIEPADRTIKDVQIKPMTLKDVGDLFMVTCDDLFERVHAWSWDEDERRSNLNLMIAKNEPRHVTDAELGEGLSRIFNAIGHCHGKKIYVSLERSKV